mmetsp:Transcript_25857/g.76437  ORF Transcript_25857/g.76437 Transcript_25857/m.76437 type:complete len:208 (+) Transcript_25857:383-1006(+)
MCGRCSQGRKLWTGATKRTVTPITTTTGNGTRGEEPAPQWGRRRRCCRLTSRRRRTQPFSTKIGFYVQRRRRTRTGSRTKRRGRAGGWTTPSARVLTPLTKPRGMGLTRLLWRRRKEGGLHVPAAKKRGGGDGAIPLGCPCAARWMTSDFAPQPAERMPLRGLGRRRGCTTRHSRSASFRKSPPKGESPSSSTARPSTTPTSTRGSK